MNIAVLIPVHNGRAFLPGCLDALLTQSGVTFQVLAVENGSTDGSAELIAREYPAVRLLRSAAGLGFAGAVNYGLRALLAAQAPPDVVVLLNQDTAVDRGWLAALVHPLAVDPSVGIVGSLARFADGRIQHAGGEILWPLGYGRNLAYGARVLPDDLPPPTYLAALATALRVTMLREIGLFDEGFNPAYFEDADLGLRAAAAGWRQQLAADATLVHYEGAATATGYGHAALIERNRLRLVLKHLPEARLLGDFLPAERAQVLERAAEGSSQVLRQAYLRALLDLHEIAAARRLPAQTRAALAAALAELRTDATALERTSRLRGLQVAQPRAEPPRHLAARSDGDEPGAPGRRPFTIGARPPVSIVMLTWNGLAYTRACLASIWANTSGVDYQLVIVDNGSTDGTREWLRMLPDITLIENAANVGFTRGNNQGMQAVPPEHDVLLLNNDTIVTQAHWLARLRDVANDHPDYGLVGCTLLRTDGALQHAGTYMPVSNFWGYQIGGGEAYVGQYPGVREVEGVVGACMYIRRDLRAAIGGLDAAFFSYFEDTDYCLRAAAAGFKVVCIGDVQVIHHENASTKLNRADWWKMFGAAQTIFVRKWQAHYQRRYTRALFWHSLVAAPTGYATSSREFLVELDKRGVDIRLACIFGTDYTEPPTKDPRVDQLRTRPKDSSLIQVVYSQGDAFTKNSGRYRIGYTMLEADGLPRDWVIQANQMDEVWTPTHWGAETFASSGVDRPIHVVPLGFNSDYFHPGITGRRASPRYTFLSVFDWIERKAPEVLLRAFVEEFKRSDDVLLLLKVFNNEPHFDIRRKVAELTRGADTPPIVLLLDQHVAPHQVGCVYRSADCLLAPTRGEGWGMPILEAMACGLPVIATDWGAQREFFHAGVGYPLRSRGLVPAVAHSPYYAGLRWADPDIDHLRHLMRYVYEHPDEARTLGAKAAAKVAEKWTWARAADRIMDRLTSIEG
jgi:GT2 family glycosyltransferase/glycosyltransferase involved in cell wall biosynthesis